MYLLKKFWSLPQTRYMDIDSAGALTVHRNIILAKPFLRFIYRGWYSQFIPAARETAAMGLPQIEIGSGASHIDNYIKGVLKTDVVVAAHIDQIVDAMKLPYADNSLGAIFVLNALHHFSEPAAFLAEAQRCLATGGRLVLVEPTNSPLQVTMIKRFHPTEYYDDSVQAWENKCDGRLSQANNALPWIIFERDRQRFDQMFPRLKIRKISRHTFFLYFASGGLSYRAFLPSFALPLMGLVEKIMGFFAEPLGTEMTIDIEKVA